MQKLYAQYGTYAAVSRIMGRSGSTVARYVKMGNAGASIQITVQNVIVKK